MVWVGQNGVEGLTENLADALHSSTAQTIYCKVHLLGGGLNMEDEELRVADGGLWILFIPFS